MALQDNLIYAYKLKRRYSCAVAIENLDDSQTTVYEVARDVLSKGNLLKWIRNEKARIRLLREEFEIVPFDKFDSWYDDRIAELLNS